MWKAAGFSILFLVMSQGASLAQWTCDTAVPVDLPYDQPLLETMGPDSWGYWHTFVLDRPAVIEISGAAYYPPGWIRTELWSACEEGVPQGLIGEYESPDFDTAAPFDSGEVALESGTYFLFTKAFWLLDFQTEFSGRLGILVRYPLDIAVLSTINPRSNGVTPVAIMGSEAFDVSDIDASTLWLGPGQAAPRHDLTDPWIYNEHLQDVNLDGFTDLVVHFRTREAAIGCDDESVTLGAVLLDGQSVEGQDSIRTVGCNPRSRGRMTRRATLESGVLRR